MELKEEILLTKAEDPEPLSRVLIAVHQSTELETEILDGKA